MFKKTIKYTDYDGNEREEDFYFNLSEAEVTKKEYSVEGGYTAMLNRIVSGQNSRAIMDEFEKFILDCYGEKSPDGRKFMKSEAIKEDFKSTPAYSIMWMELCTNADAAAEFVNKVLPQVKDSDKPALAAVPTPQA